MNIGEVMTRQVIAIGPKAPLTQAVRLMTQNRISGLPVLDRDGNIVGILTEGDMLRRVEIDTIGKPAGWISHFFTPGKEARDYVRTHGKQVGEIMSTDIVCVVEEAGLSEVVRLMQRHLIRRVPVLRDGKLQGIVTSADIVRSLATLLPSGCICAGDAAIRVALLAEIDKQPWAPHGLIQVNVTNGSVELDGCLFDFDVIDALGVVAENIDGVKEVHNRVVCVQPYMGGVAYQPAAKANR